MNKSYLLDKIFDQIDPANIYINNVIHFYDINKLLKKIKSQDELKFEDRIVQIGKYIRNPPRPNDRRKRQGKDGVTEISSILKEETKNELKNMFPKQFDMTNITKEKYDKIVHLLIDELNAKSPE